MHQHIKIYDTVPYNTGESKLDMTIINEMLLKQRAKVEEAKKAVEEAEIKKNAETENDKAARQQVKELMTWAGQYDKASNAQKHIIIANLIERIDVDKDYSMNIKFKVSAEQFKRRSA